MTKKTKIVVTLGPVTANESMIEKLIKKGIDVFRLNFSHGDHKVHKNSIDMIRKISKKIGREVAILQDISGPKVRIGEIDGILHIKKGDTIKLVKKKKDSDKYTLELSYPEIVDMVNIEEEVFFADGILKTTVIDKDNNSLTLKAENDSSLTSKKGVNFPKTKLDISSITPKDEKDLEFGAKEKVDIVALSFVQTKEDVLKAKEILKKHNYEPFIVSKIEMGKAVENLDEILEVSDGVMVARGDLGAEFGVTKLPRIQKMILKKANELNKPAITATQMLTSMKENPFPTRAEVSDIANAILDGTDAVMLSDETTVGEFPLEAVQVLVDTIEDVEKEYPYSKDFNSQDISEEISKSAVNISKFDNIKALVTFTSSGASAKTLSKFRPKKPIYANSHSISTHRVMNLFWGVKPLFVLENPNNPTTLLNDFIKRAYDAGFLTDGYDYVLTMGSSTGKTGSTNLIRVLRASTIKEVIS